MKISKLKNSFIIIILNLLYVVVKYFEFKIIKKIPNNLNLNQLRKIKKNETVVILAPGESIATLNKNQIKELSNYDIISVSYAICFPIKKDICLLETYYKNKNLNSITKCLRSQRKENKNSVIIWKNPYDIKSDNILNVYNHIRKIYDLNLLVPSNRSVLIPCLFKILIFISKISGIFSSFIFQVRGSVIGALYLALFLDYKRIIFCGVDLYNSIYFFDKPKYKYLKLKNPYKKKDKEKIHPTGDIRISIPIHKTIEEIVKSFKDKEFLTTSSKSLLSKFLPLYKFNE